MQDLFRENHSDYEYGDYSTIGCAICEEEFSLYDSDIDLETGVVLGFTEWKSKHDHPLEEVIDLLAKRIGHYTVSAQTRARNRAKAEADAKIFGQLNDLLSKSIQGAVEKQLNSPHPLWEVLGGKSS